MVTSYYIMKLTKTSNNLDFSEHLMRESASKKNVAFSCRVCLNKGTISVCDLNSKALNTLQKLCNLKICKNDNFPTKLCTVCYQFIKNAVLFIHKAKETEKLLLNKSLYKSGSKDTTNYNNVNYLSKPEGGLSNHPESTVKMELKLQENNTMKSKTISSPSTYDKKFITKSTLPQRVQCKTCKAVVMRSYFKQHMTMHDPNHSKYVCEICGKSYRLICAFYNHRFQHSTDFQHKCQLCPYKARDKALLRNHLKVHSADYKYMCTECPSRFLFKSNLNRHMWKHKEKQFSCETCKRMFHTKISVQRHHEVDHLGLKNHLCNLCGKAFGYRKALMKHQRTVHKREKREYSRMPTYLQYENKN